MIRFIFASILLIHSCTGYAQAVGIGTPAPNASAMLDVTSTTKGFLMPRMTTTQRNAIVSPAAGLTVFETTSSSVWVYNGTSWVQMASGPSSWTPSGNNQFAANSGNVGIGTNTALAKLHIASSGSNTLYLDATNPQLTFLINGEQKTFINGTGNDLKLGTISANDNGKFIVRTNGNDRLWVDSAGNVAIGLAYKVAAGYKLSVNGKVMSEGVRVQFDTEWPDYVFAEEYKLKSLPELEAFIKQKKHLPNLPSAAEVSEKGIDLGEMNAKLLEKIEELTLYIIELEKKSTSVEARLSVLENNKQ